MQVTIHKFVFKERHIELPAGEVLSVSEQHGFVSLWIERELPVSNEIKRIAHLVATGDTFNCENAKFIGTAILHDGMIVEHVYLSGVEE